MSSSAVSPEPDRSSFFERIRLRGRPVARADSIVERGNTRFTVLAPRLLRLEWSANGKFEDRATFAFPTRESPTPQYEVRDASGMLTIDTGQLALNYRLDSGPFSAENLSIVVRSIPEPVTWVPGTPNRGNLRGSRRTLDNQGSAVTLSEGIVSRDGWALHDDSRSVVFTESMDWVSPRHSADLQDWYFFGYGHDYTGALAEYMRFGGEVPLIPRYVLGAWWSRFYAYSDEELRQLVADFEAHDLPLDVLVIDMDWHTPHSWTGYTWNRELFPDPEGFLRWAHERGLRVTLNLHPAEGVQPFEEIYPEFARALGQDPASRKPVEFRAGDRRFMQTYFEMLHHPLEDQGVDFWWLDWQQGEKSDIEGLDPLLWLNHLHFQDSARRGHRPMLYSRWGGLGNHRYHIGFSGDTYSIWPALAYQPYFTATASNVLYGWWSHDIGAHFGYPGPELYARWVQYGALSPCLRLHSTNSAAAERRPWAYPQPALEAARAAFHLRYRLVPYLYTMARVASDTGISLCRPLYYAYPEHESAYAARECYFLGDNLLAAPIVRPANPLTGMATADVWVPPGTWYDYQTGESYTGPRFVRLVGDLARVPILVREGTILPLASPMDRAGEPPTGGIVIEVFPGREGAFRLYEDDGDSLAYRQDEYEWTPFAMSTEGSVCRLTIGPTEGRCPALPGERGYRVLFRGARRPSAARIGGEPARWRYDEIGRFVEVEVPATAKQAGVVVEIESEEGDVWANAEEHNRALVLEDVRRLLGNSYPDLPFENLPDAVSALSHPGRDDALARLGGPFVAAIHNTVLPEAAESVGSVIVAGPAGGSEYSVRALWSLDGVGMHRERTEVRGTGDMILHSPLAYNGAAEPQVAAVHVAVQWQGGTLTHEDRAPTLCPSIPFWRVAVYDPDGARPVPELAANGGALDWRTYDENPEALAALTDSYVVPLIDMRDAAVRAEKPLAAVAVARVVSPHERTVRIAYAPPGQGALWVNGQMVREAPQGKTPRLDIFPAMAWEACVSEPVLLPEGESAIVLDLRFALDDPAWKYRFNATVIDEDGRPSTGLRFVRGGA